MLPRREVELLGNPLQRRHPVFKTFQACLVNSASKLPDTGGGEEGGARNFLHGNFKLHLVSGRRRKPLRLEGFKLKRIVLIASVDFICSCEESSWRWMTSGERMCSDGV